MCRADEHQGQRRQLSAQDRVRTRRKGREERGGDAQRLVPPRRLVIPQGVPARPGRLLILRSRREAIEHGSNSESGRPLRATCGHRAQGHAAQVPPFVRHRPAGQRLPAHVHPEAPTALAASDDPKVREADDEGTGRSV